MLRRILLVAVLGLVSPVPVVWLFMRYGEWLYDWFISLGVDAVGSGLLAGFFCTIAAMVLIAGVGWVAVFREKQILRWFKTGKFHA